MTLPTCKIQNLPIPFLTCPQIMHFAWDQMRVSDIKSHKRLTSIGQTWSSSQAVQATGVQSLSDASLHTFALMTQEIRQADINPTLTLHHIWLALFLMVSGHMFGRAALRALECWVQINWARKLFAAVPYCPAKALVCFLEVSSCAWPSLAINQRSLGTPS